MSRHILKIDERWFDRVADGSKTAEVRKHDRDYQIGDCLVLIREAWDDMSLRGRGLPTKAIEVTVSHILPASVFPDALQVGYSVISFRDRSDVFEVATREDVEALHAPTKETK